MNWPRSSLSRCCRCIGPDVGPPCGGSPTDCSAVESIEASGIVGGTESVRFFDELRLLFADLATVGVRDGGGIGGDCGFTRAGISEGDLTRVGVSEGDLTRVGVSEGGSSGLELAYVISSGLD